MRTPLSLFIVVILMSIEIEGWKLDYFKGFIEYFRIYFEILLHEIL